MEEIFTMTTAALASRLKTVLKGFGYSPQAAGSFVYAPGGLPVMLTAHLDTVHPSPPAEIFHDREKGALWSPQGLGADDRAGVLAILCVLNQGYRPHVLFCDLEESGGLGAREAVKRLSRPDVAFILGLDRRGANDYVMYGWRSPELEALLERHGFQRALGSFSDISILCPAWKIPGANLSVGYYQEHTKAEYLRLPELYRTAARVCEVLREEAAGFFSYVAPKTPERVAGWWEDMYSYRDNDAPVCLGKRTTAKKYKIVAQK